MCTLSLPRIAVPVHRSPCSSGTETIQPVLAIMHSLFMQLVINGTVSHGKTG
ncbi:hypothetical protein J2S97_004288 [Arthrobacter oryzae]|jgi:hypothetical protein|nr:hypothetical protein [Arthrobacter oryzae]